MTKYIAKHEGQIVGTRTTLSRTYTHAVIVQVVEDVVRDQAYIRSEAHLKRDRENFAHVARVVTGIAHQRYWGNEAKRIEEHARDVATVAAGVDAYIEEQRQVEIRRFEQHKANGGFQPFVAAWCGRLDLAQKAVASHTGPSRKLVAIVPVEVVPAKLPPRTIIAGAGENYAEVTITDQEMLRSLEELSPRNNKAKP